MLNTVFHEQINGLCHLLVAEFVTARKQTSQKSIFHTHLHSLYVSGFTRAMALRFGARKILLYSSHTMAGELMSDYVDFRNQTFMDFGVVAKISVLSSEQKEFIGNSDVLGRSLRHKSSRSFFVPLERSDGVLAWDPLTEGHVEHGTGRDKS